MSDDARFLVVITRNKQDDIISSVGFMGKDVFTQALGAARARLLEQSGAVRVEVHNFESQTSSYRGKPLAVFTLDDITDEEQQRRGE